MIGASEAIVHSTAKQQFVPEDFLLGSQDWLASDKTHVGFRSQTAKGRGSWHDGFIGRNCEGISRRASTSGLQEFQKDAIRQPLFFHPFDPTGVALPVILSNWNGKRQKQPETVSPEAVDFLEADVERTAARTTWLRIRFS